MADGRAGRADSSPMPVCLAPFVSKLFEIISTATPADCIKWGPMGDTIIVTDQSKFAREVLPRYFKHDNIRSFIRQLNMYGFQRCRNPERSGSVEGEHGELEFYHEHFLKGRKDLMKQITRGMPSQKRRMPGADGPIGAVGVGVGSAAPVNGGAVQRTPDQPPGAPGNVLFDSQALLGEMTDLQQHILSIDGQLRQQCHTVTTQLAQLVEQLASSTPAPVGAAFPHAGGAPEGGAAWAAPLSAMSSDDAMDVSEGSVGGGMAPAVKHGAEQHAAHDARAMSPDEPPTSLDTA